jgi:preprotein translocase subunit YajC
MWTSMFNPLLLFADAAKEGAKDAANGAAPGKQPQGLMDSLMGMLPMILVLFFLFYFLMIRPQSKERQKRQEMLGGIKKNDRVLTIGGIYGVVMNVNKEADEVTLKVDETSNAKLRVNLSAIARIMSATPGEDEKTAE